MATTSKKMMITDVFVNGAFQGWNIATHSTIPNVLMAFVIIKMLNISPRQCRISSINGRILGRCRQTTLSILLIAYPR